MKFIKNYLKVIISFILGLMLAGGIVYAATAASQVSYTTPKNEEIKNVQEALDDLYNGQTITFIASNVACEGGDLSYRHTCTKKEKVIVMVYASTGRSGSRSISCKKNNTEVSDYVERQAGDWPLMRTYIINLEIGDYVDVAANSSGSWGDEGYMIYSVK